LNVQAVSVARVRAVDFWALTKPGITAMVVLTAAIGFYLAGGSGWDLLLHALVGTALVAAGSSAINMAMEFDRDAKMTRTEDRPIAAGRMSASSGFLFGGVLAAAGLGVLAVGVNGLTAALAAISLAIYLFGYTPLKPMTSLSTLVGAVSGAIPPMMGWTAAQGELGLGAWMLFLILFFWQLPHFLALSWMYREDYARAGFPMLAASDDGGAGAGRQAVLQTIALIVASLLPAGFGIAGPLYTAGAIVLGAGFLAFSVAFAVLRARERAVRLFMASIAYLPLLLGLLVLL
jgi:protoheme IX farnesyltransferase